MPRKYWTMKNRYCWNANLEEDAFLCLLKLYCEGRNCSETTRIVSRYARRFERKKISRQTASRYFSLFGDYCYASLPDEYDFLKVDFMRDEEAKAKWGDNLEYKQQIITMSLHQTLYKKLDWQDTINGLLITNKTQEVYNFLIKQSKSKCGIPVETFAKHFAFCMWHSLVKAHYPYDKPARAMFIHLRDMMEESPIGSFYMENMQLVRN